MQTTLVFVGSRGLLSSYPSHILRSRSSPGFSMATYLFRDRGTALFCGRLEFSVRPNQRFIRRKITTQYTYHSISVIFGWINRPICWRLDSRDDCWTALYLVISARTYSAIKLSRINERKIIRCLSKICIIKSCLGK